MGGRQSPRGPRPGTGPTRVHLNAPLESCKELLALEQFHGVRGLRAAVPIQQPPQGSVHLQGARAPGTPRCFPVNSPGQLPTPPLDPHSLPHCPSPPQPPEPPALPLAPTASPRLSPLSLVPLPHLVPGQALQEDLLRVPASLQCDEVHAVEPQPLPGLARQLPNTGLGGIPQPVPGGPGVKLGGSTHREGG